MVKVKTLVVEHAEKGSAFRLRTHSERLCIYYTHTKEHKDISFKAKNMKVLAERTGLFTLNHEFTKGFNPERIHVSSNELLLSGPELTLKLRYLRDHGKLGQFDMYDWYTGDTIVYKYNRDYYDSRRDDFINDMLN